MDRGKNTTRSASKWPGIGLGSKQITGRNMASIIKRPNGHRWIQFTNGDNKRQTIRLGKATAKYAQDVSTKVEALTAAAIAKLSWDGETAKWVADIGDALHNKLVAVGLVPKRTKTETVKLAAFIDG